MKPVAVTFTVTGALPLPINRLMRMHWTKLRKHRDQFGWLIKAAITKEDIRVLKAWRDLERKVRVSMEVSTPNLYDEDNLSSLAKQPLDFMVGMQWLGGDSPKWVEFDKPKQKQGPKAITFTLIPVE